MSRRIELRYSEELPANPALRRLERLALADRQALCLPFGAPCDPRRLVAWHDVVAIVETYVDYARWLGIAVDDVAAAIADLVDSWSCLMLACSDDKYIMLVNPYNSRVRRTLTIGHEFGHLTCGHEPLGLDPVSLDDLILRQPRFSDAQELEATDFGLALTVPYAPLLQLLDAGMSSAQIAGYLALAMTP